MAHFINEKCIGCSVCKRVCPVPGAIVGEPKKRYKVVPNLCIDCGACGRACPQDAVHDSDKIIIKRIRRQVNWDKPQIILEKCTGCVACLEACPVNCIELSAEKGTRETIRYPQFTQPKKCIACRFCETECPVDAIRMMTPEV